MAAPRRNIAYNKPAEPSFVRAFKQKVGYKEPESIESKFDPPKIDESKIDDREDKPEEQPTVVSLRPGDLTQEEYDGIKKKEEVAQSPSRDGKSEPAQDPGGDNSAHDESKKVVFQRRSKRLAADGPSGSISASTKKRKKSDDTGKESSAKNSKVGVKAVASKRPSKRQAAAGSSGGKPASTKKRRKRAGSAKKPRVKKPPVKNPKPRVKLIDLCSFYNNDNESD